MALREVLASFGFDVDTDKLDRANNLITITSQRVQSLIAYFVGGAFTIGAARFISSIADQGDRLNDLSNRLGIGAEDLQELGFAAAQSGSSVENLTVGLLMLSDKVGDALVNATGEGAKAFAKYHISLKDASGGVKDTGALLAEIADRIAGAKTEYEKVTIAQDLFGRQGKVLLPLLKEGADGLAELREEARDLGGGFSKEAVKASDAFNDSLGRMGVVSDSARGAIATAILPALTRFVDVATNVAAVLVDVAKNSSVIETVFASLGIAVAALGIKLLISFAPLLATTATIALLGIIIEDIVTTFRGGESVVGRFVDKLYGFKDGEERARAFRDGLESIVQMFKDAITLAELFNKLTSGEKFTVEDLRKFNQISAAIGLNPQDRAAMEEPIAIIDNLSRASNRRQATAALAAGPAGFATFAPPAAASVVGGGTTVDATSNTTIHVNGGDPNEVRNVIRDEMATHRRKVRDALVKHKEPSE